jgi:hypothetical protein
MRTRTIDSTIAMHKENAASAIKRGPKKIFSEASRLGKAYSLYSSGLYCAGR